MSGRIIILSLFLIIAYYLGFGLYLFFAQRRLIYFPGPQANFYDCPLFHDAEKISFQGTRFYYKKNSRRLLVHYHGNADTACNSFAIKEILDELGYSFIFVEYAGYAGDTRKPSRELILKDVRNVHEYIKTLPHEQLVLMGESLGSGAASYHASLAYPQKILLLSPFDRLGHVAQKFYPLYPVRWLLTEEYDNVLWLKNQKGNLLIIHGAKEEVVPAEFGRKLYESAEVARKDFMLIQGAGHNDIFFHTKTQEAIRVFLAEE